MRPKHSRPIRMRCGSCRCKEQQFADAINTALGIDFTRGRAARRRCPSRAVPAPPPRRRRPWGRSFPDQVVRRQAAVHQPRVGRRRSGRHRRRRRRRRRRRAWPPVTPNAEARDDRSRVTATLTVPSTRRIRARISHARRLSRTAIRSAMPPRAIGPRALPAVLRGARYACVEACLWTSVVPVTRREAQLPYGYVMRELTIVPAAGRDRLAAPGDRAAGVGRQERSPAGGTDQQRPGGKQRRAHAEAAGGMDSLSRPRFRSRSRAPGERARYQFTVARARQSRTASTIDAVATAGGRDYRRGIATSSSTAISRRAICITTAASAVRGVDVKIAPGLKVGYVMGVGDDVPAGIAQLRAQVQLLGAQDLAAADLQPLRRDRDRTRAYAVRDDLRTYNQRLLDYVEARRQPGRALQHARLSSIPGSSRPTRPAAARRRRSVGGGLAGDDPGAGAAGVHHAERHLEGRLRRLGRAARLEVLQRVGPGATRR